LTQVSHSISTFSSLSNSTGIPILLINLKFVKRWQK
jgi:hypothetical protein